jgi:hypothetical protein
VTPPSTTRQALPCEYAALLGGRQARPDGSPTAINRRDQPHHRVFLTLPWIFSRKVMEPWVASTTSPQKTTTEDEAPTSAIFICHACPSHSVATMLASPSPRGWFPGRPPDIDYCHWRTSHLVPTYHAQPSFLAPSSSPKLGPARQVPSASSLWSWAMPSVVDHRSLLLAVDHPSTCQPAMF